MQIPFLGIFPRSEQKCFKNQIRLCVYTGRIVLRYIYIYIYIHVNCDLSKKVLLIIEMVYSILILNSWRRIYFFIFSTSSILNVDNTGTKYDRIMKQTEFRRGKNEEYIPFIKYSVPIFVE